MQIIMIMTSTCDANTQLHGKNANKEANFINRTQMISFIFDCQMLISCINRICGKIHAEMYFRRFSFVAIEKHNSNWHKDQFGEKQKSNRVRSSNSQSCKMLRLATCYQLQFAFYSCAFFVCVFCVRTLFFNLSYMLQNVTYVGRK